MKTLFDAPAKRTRKPSKMHEAWNTILDLKAALKKARIERDNWKRLAKGARGV